jgi:hypothetical protein
MDEFFKAWLVGHDFAAHVDMFEAAGYSSAEDIASQDEFNARCIAEEEIGMPEDDVKHFLLVYKTCVQVQQEEPPPQVIEEPELPPWRPVPRLGYVQYHVFSPSVQPISLPFPQPSPPPQADCCCQHTSRLRMLKSTSIFYVQPTHAASEGSDTAC